MVLSAEKQQLSNEATLDWEAARFLFWFQIGIATLLAAMLVADLAFETGQWSTSASLLYGASGAALSTMYLSHRLRPRSLAFWLTSGLFMVIGLVLLLTRGVERGWL